MTKEQLIIEIITIAIIALSAFFVWLSIHRTNMWNRKKGAQEILNQFIVGDIPDLNKKIKIDFRCTVYNHDNQYSKFTKDLTEIKKLEFDDVLMRMLNIFEVIGINIQNKIIKETICFDYLAWFYTEYYRFSKELIEQKRNEAGDKRILEHFEKYALRWSCKMTKNMSSG